ncbi:MAG: hypothetical protein HN712_01190 [Gemmatimonadetes bacterium]|jgi:hypothetical protein|nr:hypothetical protein [Gemmatimonadota bacterium]MBT6147139.1 hypothetical protein [Gemmatimonadota bacterium]MBT7858886.1 hypothetical protein [Gemmatimonadota bacterium]
MTTPADYGIIYNWDGAPHGYTELPQSMDQFLQHTYAPLQDTQVGALFWCIGEHASRWQSEGLELLGNEHGRVYENAYNYNFTENIRQMLERGEDPQAALVERGHELGLHVYASVRMNDNHFNGTAPADIPHLHHTEMTGLRRQHPEWLLGDETEEWYAASWNMSVPEVREHRFTHLREACERYDWDGVELDWQRHAFHLPEDDAYRLRYVLTDVQRAARQLAQRLAAERGRPFYVAARVAGSLEMCRRIGYDIPTWIEEGLVDMLIPAGNAATDPDAEVEQFVDLCRGTDIVVYPGFDGALAGVPSGPEDATTREQMSVRGIASRHYRAGATGMYAFNWHAGRDTRRELLTQVGSPKTLQGTDKIYAATHRFFQKEGEWRGAYRRDRILGQVPVALKPTMTGDGPTIRLDLGDEHTEKRQPRFQLRLRLDEWVRGDEVRIQWDGIELVSPDIRFDRGTDPDPIGDFAAAVWFRFDLDAAQVTAGQHQVKVALVTRNPQVASDLILTDAELVVT